MVNEIASYGNSRVQKGGEQMTEKQERFIDEYIIDFNATRAAIAAGYSSKRANSQGVHLLSIPCLLYTSMPSPHFLVELAKIFSVSTDFLLGVESLHTINVSDLSAKDVAMLTDLADRLRSV